MPNQRSKTKTYLGGFVERELYQRIVRLAAKAGMKDNKFGFAAQLIQEAIKRRKRRRKAASPRKIAKGTHRRTARR